MQDFTSSTTCASGIATDRRDGKTYNVNKINNVWWMTTNLDLDGGTTLTSTYSHVSSSYTLPASSTSNFNGSSSGGAYVYNSNSTNCHKASSPGDTTTLCYSYYSYKAACVGSDPSSGSCSYDICPSRWRLPTQSEYQTLIGTYTSGATLTVSPWFGVYGGYIDNDDAYCGPFCEIGDMGWYWSSTAYNSVFAQYMQFSSSSARMFSYGPGALEKDIGLAVRCKLQ